MQVVVVVQEAVIQVAPTSSSSAPAMGKNPEPVIVTRVGLLLGPCFGEDTRDACRAGLGSVLKTDLRGQSGDEVSWEWATMGDPSPLAMS